MTDYKDIEAMAADEPATLVADAGSVPQPIATREPTTLALRITAALQTTLDLTRQIEIFSRTVGETVAHDGVNYSHDDPGVIVEQGTPARNSCTWRLTLEGRVLGQIRFTRRQPFEDEEIALLEYLLCALVYPLRNALEHKTALDEARRDPLTGVHNRGVIESALMREVGLAHRHNTPFSLVFVDVDRFKSINDTHGHDAGDGAIRLFADILQTKIRATDILARFGGDEFVILLTNTPAEGAELLAHRIREAVEAADTRAIAVGLKLTTSIGVATLEKGEGAEQFLKRADAALAEAKRLGRNRVCG